MLINKDNMKTFLSKFQLEEFITGATYLDIYLGISYNQVEPNAMGHTLLKYVTYSV